MKSIQQLRKEFASYFRAALSDKSKSQQGMLLLDRFIK